MRIKISFTDPSNRKVQKVLLSVPEHLKNIIDLEVFLIDKLKLGKYLENTKTGILLKINGFSLPKSEKIKDLVSDDDHLEYKNRFNVINSLSFIENKRKAEKNIENDFEEILERGFCKNEEERDRNFLKMLEEVSLLRRIYHKMRNSEAINEPEALISNKLSLKKKNETISAKESESEEEEVPIKVKSKKVPVVQPKKNKIIEYNSSESSEEETLVVKKKETKILDEKPKPAKDKIISKKIQKEEDDEDEPKVIEKKIDPSKSGLRILSPREQFQIKKEEWKTCPISQWTSKQNKDKNDQQPKLKKNKVYNKAFETQNEAIVDPKFINFVPSQGKFEAKKTIQINKKFVEEEKPKIPKNFTVVPLQMIKDLWKNQSRLFFKINDVIKYKCEILTAENQPGISDFRFGNVVETNKNQLVIDRSNFMRVNEEEENEVETTDTLFLHNLHEVLISEEFLDEERKKLIQTFMDNATKFILEQKELLEKKKLQLQEKLKAISEKPENTSEQNNQELNPEKMKKQIIGKQINFYFSDKNYFRDDFIQTHCSRHPENFMDIKLLLNFPKIRQMTTEVSTILDSIELVNNLPNYEINFELNSEKTLIRKKPNVQQEKDSKDQPDKISKMKNLLYSSNFIELSVLIQKYGSPSSVILHHNLAGSLECFKDSAFDIISIVIGNNDKFELAHFGALYNILKAGGTLEVSGSSNWQDAWIDLITASGFKIESKNGNSSLTAKKPDWAGKGVASLKNRKQNDGKIEPENETKKVQESAPENKVNPFTSMAVESKAETIDEDDLLANESGYNKLEKPEDCSTKPKACKDCSCGRAEMEKNPASLEEKINKIEKGDVSSGCGNCYLGDAFRCSSCPYKGLPAFKPGDKIKLDLTKDNVGGILNENSTVKVSNGKVKLDI